MVETENIQKGFTLSAVNATYVGHIPVDKRCARLYLKKGTIYQLTRNNIDYLISEDYQYKTTSYYKILENEAKGQLTIPSSREILDAFVLPICLEKAKKFGIPTVNWRLEKWNKLLPFVDMEYPAILYAMGPYAETDVHYEVRNEPEAKLALNHLTNGGKYSYIIQRIPDRAKIVSLNVIMGWTSPIYTPILQKLAKKVFNVFQIPLMRIRLVECDGNYYLSSIGMVDYSKLDSMEREQLYEIIHE
jgi:hypothetical protein